MGSMHMKNVKVVAGKEVIVRGRFNSDAVRSEINVGDSSEGIALHFNPRFDQRTIVMNSKKDGSWQEELVVNDFPYEAGQEFEVTIVHNSDTFDIYLQDGRMIQFPNRLGCMKYEHLHFPGDARIQDVVVRPSLKPTKR